MRALIGRSSERATLARFLEEVGRGPAGLLLEGEVGIGKTELWREGVRAAVARSYCVLACRPDDSETSLAYAALGDLLEPQLETVQGALAPLRRRALETALLRGETGQAADRRAVSLAVFDALRVLAARSPVLLAVDDLQWLDGSSAHVLRFALRRLDHDRIGVPATGRLTGDGELGSLIEPNEIERLRIGRLGEDELDAVLRARLGESFLRATVRRLHTSSGGNPFFALELARALLRGSKLPLAGEPLPVPETLRNLVWERLAGLPADVRGVLLVVAARSQATVGVLEEVVGSHERTLAQLGAAVEAGVLEVDQGRVRFAHPLLREVLYAEAGEKERRRVHGRLAQVVRDPEEQARHLGLATELPDAKVAAVLEEASRRAGARGAPDAAASFAEHALRLTPAELGQDALRRAIVTSDYLWDSGETGRARRQLDELAATLPPGEDRARVLRRLARAEAYERGFEPVVPLLGRARVEAGGNTSLLAAVERDLGLALTQLGKLRAAELHARAGVRLAEAAERVGLLDDARATLETVRFMLGRGPPTDLRQRAAAPLERDEMGQERQPILLQRSLTWAAMLKWTDDFDAARQALERLRTHLSIRQEEALLYPVLFHLGELECWSGNLESARRWATEMKNASARAGQPGLRAQSLYLEALVESLVGEVAAARAHGIEGLRLAEEANDGRVAIRQLKVLGTLDLSLGEPARAELHLTQAIERSTAAGYGDPGFFRLEADAIEALTATGQLDRAARVLVRLEQRGEKLGRAWALATAGRCRALLASARGDPTAALVAVERSLQEHARLAEPLELGRTLLVEGTLRRRTKQRRLARASLENAHELFQQLGAPLWAARARAELARISGRAPAASALTQTEGRVAEL